MADIVSNVSDLGIIVAAFRLTLGQSNLVNEQVANRSASIATDMRLDTQDPSVLTSHSHENAVFECYKCKYCTFNIMSILDDRST